MLIKKRSEPVELRSLKGLDDRMDFAEKEKQQLLTLKKGYEGEIILDVWLEQLIGESLILNDLLLEWSGTTFQLDSVVITQDITYLFDAKNYEGDYYYDGERLKLINGKEIKDPLLQLKRSESLLRQLLNHSGFHLPVAPYIIFTNPGFTLYQAPLDQPIVFPSQLNRFMKKLNSKQSKLNNQHRKLAERLLSLDQTNLSSPRLPHYSFEQLVKGIKCAECNAMFSACQGKNFLCGKCGGKEFIDTAVMKNVEEFRLLFPDRRITIKEIYQWCDYAVSKKVIRRILSTYLRPVGGSKVIYYDSF